MASQISGDSTVYSTITQANIKENFKAPLLGLYDPYVVRRLTAKSREILKPRNLTGIFVAQLLRCLSNFGAIGKV